MSFFAPMPCSSPSGLQCNRNQTSANTHAILEFTQHCYYLTPGTTFCKNLKSRNRFNSLTWTLATFEFSVLKITGGLKIFFQKPDTVGKLCALSEIIVIPRQQIFCCRFIHRSMQITSAPRKVCRNGNLIHTD